MIIDCKTKEVEIRVSEENSSRSQTVWFSDCKSVFINPSVRVINIDVDDRYILRVYLELREGHELYLRSSDGNPKRMCINSHKP